MINYSYVFQDLRPSWWQRFVSMKLTLIIRKNIFYSVAFFSEHYLFFLLMNIRAGYFDHYGLKKKCNCWLVTLFRNMLFGATFTWVVQYGLMAFCKESYIFYCIIRFLCGGYSAVVTIIPPTILCDMYTDKERSIALLYFTLFGYFGR